MQCHADVLDMITTGCTRQQTKAGMVKTAMLSKSLGVVTGKQHCVKLMRIYVNYRLKKKNINILGRQHQECRRTSGCIILCCGDAAAAVLLLCAGVQCAVCCCVVQLLPDIWYVFNGFPPT